MNEEGLHQVCGVEIKRIRFGGYLRSKTDILGGLDIVCVGEESVHYDSQVWAGVTEWRAIY